MEDSWAVAFLHCWCALHSHGMLQPGFLAAMAVPGRFQLSFSPKPSCRPQAIAAGMFLDSLPQTLTPLELGGAGAAHVQQGLSQTLRAVLDVQVRRRRAAKGGAWTWRSMSRALHLPLVSCCCHACTAVHLCEP